MQRIDRDLVGCGEGKNRVSRPVKQRTEFQHIAPIRGHKGCAPAMAGLIRPKADDPAGGAGQRTPERLEFAGMTTGRSCFTGIVESIDPLFLDERFQVLVLRTYTLDSLPIQKCSWM